MKITTVLLDAGGVILDESEHEAVRADITVEILSAIIPGYSVSVYHSDIEEAVQSFCPSTYPYVFWKYLKEDRALFDEIYTLYLGNSQKMIYQLNGPEVEYGPYKRTK